MLNRYVLDDEVVAFSTTRHGGVSQGSYASFNITHYCDDSLEHVARNKALLADLLGISSQDIILPRQTHQTNILHVDADFLYLSESQRSIRLEAVDALMTDQPKVCIGVSTADCIPILLYDKEHHAIAAVHAGWRGTVTRIVGKTIGDMQQAFGTQPSHLRAVVGPGISLKKFEVGDEVYMTFQQAGFDMNRIARRYAKWHIDLPLCNRLQLEKAGVNAANILMSGICTYDHVADYFSARRLGIRSGRIFTGIIINTPLSYAATLIPKC